MTEREEELARTVFRDTLPYERIRVTNAYLPGSTGAVTISTSAARRFANYFIFWDAPVFEIGADACSVSRQATFIHELAHVWQGHHDRSSATYMVKSVVAQCRHGVRDVIERRAWLAWDVHRSRAYDYAHKPCLPWRAYNVEQQASIVGDWFDARIADCSPADWRYFYIENVIRARDPRARGRPPLRVDLFTTSPDG